MTSIMRILVCLKQSVDVDSVKADRASGLITTEGAGRKTNDFDKNALEEALRIRDKLGGNVDAATVGGRSGVDTLKEALSMGADRAFQVADPAVPEWDSRAVSIALSRLVALADAPDLVLLGEGSVDHYSSQVGPRLAFLLNWPLIGYARKIEASNDSVTVEKDMEFGVQVVETRLPAVVTVVQEINQPRLPTLKSILAASKKEVRQVGLQQLGLSVEQVQPVVKVRQITSPKSQRKRVVIDGSKPAEAAQKLIANLRSEGVI